ncbi:MAG TPA: hypothetical protein VK206_06665 [Anaerolineales bacterium]|nr:hypothetical protein [Anaerolineales bacterium]
MFTVMYHSLLIGASLLVPVPFLDEKLAAFLWKHMVSDLAKSHNKTLTNDQLLALSHQFRFSFSDGCLLVVKRLFQELFQQILFFLEWRKAINLATDAYYSGYLLNELFSYEGFDPAKSGQYAIALQKAKQGTNTKLVRNVFKSTFRSGKGVLASIVKWLSSITVGYVKDSWTRRKKRKNAGSASEEQMESFFAMHRSRFQELLKDLITHLQNGIGGLPKEHFDHLRNKLFDEVRNMESS